MDYKESEILKLKKSNSNQIKINLNVDTNPSIRQNWILSYLDKNNQIKSKIIQNKFEINQEIASRDLNSLIKKDKIIKKGTGNNVWYEIK